MTIPYTFENGQTIKESPSEISVSKLSVAYQALIAARQFLIDGYIGSLDDCEIGPIFSLIDEALKDAV